MIGMIKTCCLLLALGSLTIIRGARIPGEAHLIATDTERSIVYSSEAETDRVLSLPGYGSLKGKINVFSGYVTVDKEAGRALFYVLVESHRNVIEDPLVLWLNGGPGCSSLGGGFLSELGPWFPNQDGKTLQENPNAWNRKASTLFLDSPAFVGFSYSNTSSDVIVGDERTAKDSRSFMLGFMERFPHLRKNDFFISGESYAGHYVPNLALEIVKGNAHATSEEQSLNLKGILVGNPWTDTVTDNLGAVDFWWMHAMISDASREGLKSTCDFSNIGPLDAAARSKEEQCDKFVDRAFKELGPINIYEIYADICAQPVPDTSDRTAKPKSKGLANRLADLLSTSPRQSGGSRLRSKALSDDGYDPCIDNEVETYLNLPDVQRALHAIAFPYPWTDCSNLVQYSRKDLLSSVLTVYEELLDTANLRILIYSGDVDGIVPVVGTRRWTAGLGLKIEKPWRPWLSGSQVGGHIEEYEGLTFATVRNAGHMVPYVQPERMFTLLMAFLEGRSP